MAEVAVYAFWILAAFSVAIFVRALATRASRLIANQSRLRAPRFEWNIRANPRVFVTASIFASTYLIVKFPELGVWNYVTSEGVSSQVGPATLLGASAALLALLLFAANQLHGAQKDAESAGTYLGENRKSFGAGRSSTTRLFSDPPFHVTVIALFALPLLRPVLPTELTTPQFGPVSAASLDPRTMALAMWCSCFALVGTVLILNALATLRAAALNIRAPWRTDRYIERELQRRSRTEYAKLISSRPRSSRYETESWVGRHLRYAQRLPAAEQLVYLRITVGVHGEVAQRHQLIRQLQDAFEEGARTSQSDLRWWRDFQRRRAVARLRGTHDVTYGRTRALLHHVSAREFTDDARAWVVNQCLLEAQGIGQILDDGLGRRLTPRLPDAGTGTGRPVDTATALLLTPVADLPALEDHPFGRLGRPDDSPTVVMLPAFTFQALADLISARGVDRRLHLQDPVISSIVHSAERISDDETRNHALHAVVGALIKALIVDRHRAALADHRFLAAVIEQRDRSRAAIFTEPHDRTTVEDVIQQSAFTALQTQPLSDQQTVGRLLDLVSAANISTLVLYRLLYAHRSHTLLAVSELTPFYSALRRYWSEELYGDPRGVPEAVEILCSSNVSHFVTRRGLTWLLESLHEPLSLRLCARFLEHRREGAIFDFDLREFLLWRLVTGQVDRSWNLEATSGICALDTDAITNALPDLKHLIDDWRSVDQRAAADAAMTFMPLAMDLGW